LLTTWQNVNDVFADNWPGCWNDCKSRQKASTSTTSDTFQLVAN